MEEIRAAYAEDARCRAIDDEFHTATQKRKFALLQRLYNDLPEPVDYRIDPYLIDWLRVFTPIEEDAWQALRGGGLPFFPQFPACGYFLDFADPQKRIALEADGARWHDPARDEARDERLWLSGGWRVYRVTGRECASRARNPAELRDMGVSDEDAEQEGRDWLYASVEGVAECLRSVYYRSPAEPPREFAHAVLNRHRLVQFPIDLVEGDGART